jgi:hypothetical protein
MDKERLEARRAKLVEQRDRMVANVQRLSGALALLDELIAEIDAPAAPEPPKET